MFSPICRDVVSVLNVSVLRRSRDVFWNVSVLKVECLGLETLEKSNVSVLSWS